MSVLSRGQATATASIAGPTSHTIVWTVSAHALRAVRPELIAEGRGDASLETRIEIGGERFHAQVVVRHGGRDAELEDISGAVEHGSVGGCTLVHLDGEELVATLRVRGSEFETLYARLPLLARLGVAGGRYELRPG
jgi:hypothetical protein